MCMYRKNVVHVGLCTLCAFRHLLWVLESIPCRYGGLHYAYCSCDSKTKPLSKNISFLNIYNLYMILTLFVK